MRDACVVGVAALVSIAGSAHADVTSESFSIGQSAMGRSIDVVAIGETNPDGFGRLRDERPALLIVGGLNASHTFGTETARALVDRLMAEQGDALATTTVYILAVPNPDGAAFVSDAATPSMNWGRAPAPTDADNDRRISEDPADDLNGDGMITMMRVKNPDPRFALDVDMIIDPDKPRLMRKAKPSDGEVGQYAVLIEGYDNDGDGQFNEDGYAGTGGGGVDLDRNFPSHWADLAEGAGAYPLSRSETLAIVRWVQSRPNIAAVLTYGARDNLINTPTAGKFGPDGKMPTGILDDDKPYYEHVGKAFKDLTKITSAPKGDNKGSFAHWAYTDAGLWSFETTVWVRPDQRKKEDAEDGDEGADDKPEEEVEEQTEADKLRERGVPEEIVKFLEGTESEHAEMMAMAQSMSDAERAERMQMLQSLPEDVRQRVFAKFSGGGGAPDGPGRARRGGRGGGSAGGGDSKSASKKDNEDKKWLALADERGEGFIDWIEVEHPQFGTVEVGGFVPGFKTTPTPDEMPGLIDEQVAFVGKLLGMLADLEVDQPVVESVGAGLWRVSIEARNPGYLPTASAMSVTARRIAPIIIALDPEQTLDREQFVTGQRHVRINTIEGSGGTARGQWLIRAEPGDQVNLEVRSAAYGDREFVVRFEEGR